MCVYGFPCGSDSKEFACNVGDLGSIPVSGRFPVKGMATHSWVAKSATYLGSLCCLRLRIWGAVRMGSEQVDSKTLLKLCRMLSEFGGILAHWQYSFLLMFESLSNETKCRLLPSMSWTEMWKKVFLMEGRWALLNVYTHLVVTLIFRKPLELIGGATNKAMHCRSLACSYVS